MKCLHTLVACCDL